MSDRDKYRVYDKSNEVYIDDTIYITPDGELIVIGKGSDEENCFEDTTDYIVERCTGIKDIDGKLIHEGDIVEYYIDDVMSVYCLVYWDINQWCIKNDVTCDYSGLEDNEVLIIGNIHEEGYKEIVEGRK